MDASDDPRRVHFQSPEYLVDWLDAITDLFDKDRTDVLVEAMREYIEDTADSESFQELVATSVVIRNQSLLQPFFEILHHSVPGNLHSRFLISHATLESWIYRIHVESSPYVELVV